MNYSDLDNLQAPSERGIPVSKAPSLAVSSQALDRGESPCTGEARRNWFMTMLGPALATALGCSGAQNFDNVTIAIPPAPKLLQVTTNDVDEKLPDSPPPFVWNGEPCTYDTGLGYSASGKWIACEMHTFAEPDKDMGDGQTYLQFRASHTNLFPLLNQCVDFSENGEPLTVTFGDNALWQVLCVAPANPKDADRYPFQPAQPDKGKLYDGNEGQHCVGKFILTGDVHGMTTFISGFNPTLLTEERQEQTFASQNGVAYPPSFRNASEQCRVTFTGKKGDQATIEIDHAFEGPNVTYVPSEL